MTGDNKMSNERQKRNHRLDNIYIFCRVITGICSFYELLPLWRCDCLTGSKNFISLIAERNVRNI